MALNDNIKFHLLFLVFTLGQYATKANNNYCEPGWDNILIQGRTVCIYRDQTPRNWEDTRTFCQSLGDGKADMLVGLQEGFTQQVHDLIKYTSGFNSIWLSLSRKDDNLWQWDAGPQSDADSIQTPYRNWSPSHDNTYSCSSMSPFSDNWADSECNDYLSTVCHKKVTDSQCPDDWVEVMPGECLKMVTPATTKRSYNESRVFCLKNHQAGLLQIKSAEMEEKFIEYMRRFHSPWLGLKNTKESEQHWVSGLKLDPNETFTDWLPKYPLIDTNVRCAYMSQKTKWKNSPCSDLSQTTCLMDSRVGPGHTYLEIGYHRMDKVLFNNHNWTVKCSAIGAAESTIIWVKSYNDIIFGAINAGLFTTKIETIALSGSLRAIKTTSTFNIANIYSEALEGHILSCFSIKAETQCRRQSDAVRLCDLSAPLRFIDPPKWLPELEINYPGSPGPVDGGSNVTITCKVSTGSVGALNWITYLHNTSTVLDKSKSPVIFYQQQGQNISSTVSFLMSKDKVGLQVACFAYDLPAEDQEDWKCLDSDDYCKKSHALKLGKETESGPFVILSITYWWIYLLVFFLLTCAVVWLATKRKDKSSHPESEEPMKKAYYIRGKLKVKKTASDMKRTALEMKKTAIEVKKSASDLNKKVSGAMIKAKNDIVIKAKEMPSPKKIIIRKTTT